MPTPKLNQFMKLKRESGLVTSGNVANKKKRPISANKLKFSDLVRDFDERFFPKNYFPDIEIMSDGKIFYKTKKKVHNTTEFCDIYWLLFTLEGELIQESLYEYAEIPDYECYIVCVPNDKHYRNRDIIYITNSLNVRIREIREKSQAIPGINNPPSNSNDAVEYVIVSADLSGQRKEILDDIQFTIDELELDDE